MRKENCALLAATMLSGMALSGTAGAQTNAAANTSPPPVATPSPTGAVGDIIVTAQRRATSLERTPVAITVVTADALVKRAVTSESDLVFASPGLLVRQGENSNQINYVIRGQSLDAFSNTRPGVLPYVDEVQVGGNGGASAFYDLQSVQVLKGPQGTLFGRNATGGAVLFTTQKPTNDFSGYVMGRLGNYSQRYVEGAINIPIVDDKILARVSGVYDKRDGFQKNLFDDTRAGDVNRFGVRGSLTLKPVSGFKNELVVDYLHAGGNSTQAVLDSLKPDSLLPIAQLTNFGNQAQFNSILNAFTGGAAGCNATTNNCAAIFAAANPKLDPGGFVSFLAGQKARGPYLAETNGPNVYKGRTTIISNVTSYDVADDTQIRNIIGYTHILSANSGSVDGTPYVIDDQGTLTYRTHQFSEELQLQGKALDQHLSYVFGGFYSNETSDYSNTGVILGFPLIAGIQSYVAKNTNKTYAGYAQGTYDLSGLGIKGLGITAGLRYTSEQVGYQTLPEDESHNDPTAVQAAYVFDQSKTYHNLSWTFGIQEQLDAHTLLYVASRRSYRNGGYNDSARPKPGLGTEGGNGYDTERVTDIEIGAKHSGVIAAMPFRANIALYNNWIINSQRAAYTLIAGAPSGVTVNVPKARVRGVEFDTSINLTPWLQVGGAVNYTDAKFTKGLVSIAGSAPVILGTYPDTPKWSGNGFAEVDVPLSGSITGSLRGDVYGQTGTFFTSSGNTNPLAQTPGYKLVNFRVGIADDHAGWSLAGVVKNAFNHTYYVGGIGLGELFGENTIVPGDRRTFLVELRYKF
jgi:iron complex outermembrane receptor protein